MLEHTSLPGRVGERLHSGKFAQSRNSDRAQYGCDASRVDSSAGGSDRCRRKQAHRPPRGSDDGRARAHATPKASAKTVAMAARAFFAGGEGSRALVRFLRVAKGAARSLMVRHALARSSLRHPPGFGCARSHDHQEAARAGCERMPHRKGSARPSPLPPKNPAAKQMGRQLPAGPAKRVAIAASGRAGRPSCP